METKPSEISSGKMFGGYNKRFKHFSPTLGCSMNFHIYFPPSPSPSHKFPVLYFLAGLTCTDENFIFKSGAQRVAAAEGIALVTPDTSPRGLNVEGEADSWDFGVGLKWFFGRLLALPFPITQKNNAKLDQKVLELRTAQMAAQFYGSALLNIKLHLILFGHGGENEGTDLRRAGFYLNATQEKWKNWRMYDYVVKELPKLLSDNFPQLETSKASIFGHSMGGHVNVAEQYSANKRKIFSGKENVEGKMSVSAFAPITNPINCPWGQKAFPNYLGDNKSEWEEYDATCLVTKFPNVSSSILIDQGEDDQFFPYQLLPHNFEEACRKANVPLLLRFHPGYDHGYYFIATFVDDHIRHHAQALRLN
ncbi:hypothetical protein V8G54_027762 [Vigna mungo]|uniref:S-formylglutathione hydrolase n=1 Tax=Vigna mungo TaxID=3915 RepID=A0AAQ3MR63_VIGMU